MTPPKSRHRFSIYLAVRLEDAHALQPGAGRTVKGVWNSKI